jgi:hypothetical protein
MQNAAYNGIDFMFLPLFAGIFFESLPLLAFLTSVIKPLFTSN